MIERIRQSLSNVKKVTDIKNIDKLGTAENLITYKFEIQKAFLKSNKKKKILEIRIGQR